jgi:peroxiredoxin
MRHESQTRRTFLSNAGLIALVSGAGANVGRPSAAWAAVKVGEAAPPFTATTSTGPSVSLGDYRGKIVILEWTNHDCPYVKKHYETTNMQALQKEATGQGVIWLTVISSAPGTQGYVSPSEANELTSTRQAAPTAVVLDPKGTVGKMYGATNTPHMYIVDKGGVLVYAGAIDDKPTTRRSDVQGAQNYVRAALQAVSAGQPVKTPVTRAYGCTVKYA